MEILAVTSSFVTKKFNHYPKIDHSSDTNVLIIGIEYTKTLRDQWHSINYSLKRTYISRDPLVTATLPALDRMKAYDYKQSEAVTPSNVIKRDFLCVLCTEY